jgi:hypothetical protein
MQLRSQERMYLNKTEYIYNCWKCKLHHGQREQNVIIRFS